MRSATGAHHVLRVAPEPRFGKWTLALATGSVAGLVLLAVGFATGALESASSFSDNWLLAGWGVAVLACGAGSVVTGSLAIIRHHDRSWPVLVATGVGMLVTAVVLNEVVQGLR